MWNIKAIYAYHSIENLKFLISSVYIAFVHHGFTKPHAGFPLNMSIPFSGKCTETAQGNVTSVAP
jgi:hypothetical protein